MIEGGFAYRWGLPSVPSLASILKLKSVFKVCWHLQRQPEHRRDQATPIVTYRRYIDTTRRCLRQTCSSSSLIYSASLVRWEKVPFESSAFIFFRSSDAFIGPTARVCSKITAAESGITSSTQLGFLPQRSSYLSPSSRRTSNLSIPLVTLLCLHRSLRTCFSTAQQSNL